MENEVENIGKNEKNRRERILGGRGDFFFNDPATAEIYTLSLHDALPISIFFVSRKPSKT